MECREWDAWRDRMPGADPTVVHVAGVCTVPSSSVRLKLELGNEGIIDDPKLIALDLTSSRPDIGDDLMTEKDVSWAGPVDDRVINVRIQGEGDAHIDVRDVH
jgi:hypothetical protein